MALKNFLQGSNGETDTENRIMDMGRGEERVRCMERVKWKLTLPCLKQMDDGNMQCGSGNSNRDFASTWRGGMGREMGGGF